jgi:hypothetical protein
MDLTFAQNQYELEWQRRDQLQSASGVPIGILTLLGSALVYLLKEFETPTLLLSGFFWTMALLATLAYGIAVYMSVRSYYGYLYQRIPLPSQLQAHQAELLAYHRKSGGREGDAQRDFEDFLCQRYIDATDRNAANNINRGAYLHNANSAVAVCLVFTLFSGAVFGVHVKLDPSKPQRVEITNIPEASMTEEKDQPKKENAQPIPNAGKPSSFVDTNISKPAGPKNIDVRTGFEVPKKKN